MSTVKKPILGITMGDPFGNGPEITVRALADETVYDRCRPPRRRRRRLDGIRRGGVQ